DFIGDVHLLYLCCEFILCYIPLFCVEVFVYVFLFFFFSSRRRHTRSKRDWSSDVCSSDLSSVTHNDVGGCSGKFRYASSSIRRTMNCLPGHPPGSSYVYPLRYSPTEVRI